MKTYRVCPDDLQSLIFLAALTVLSGCGNQPAPEDSNDPGKAVAAVEVTQTVTELLGGSVALKTIQSAPASAWLLPANSYHQNSLSEYEMREGPVALSEQQQENLVEILTAHESYLHDIAKGCAPDYGVRVRFKNPDSPVDILFCFGCSQLQVYVNGQSTSGGEFDPAEQKLIHWVQSVFPDDAVIQSLNSTPQ